MKYKILYDVPLSKLATNGCGKSTLIKLIMGQLEATGGTITRDSGSRIAYIAQHHLDQLDADSTPLRLKFPYKIIYIYIPSHCSGQVVSLFRFSVFRVFRSRSLQKRSGTCSNASGVFLHRICISG